MPHYLSGLAVLLGFMVRTKAECAILAHGGGILSPRAQFVTASFEPCPADGWCPRSPADCLELLGIGDHSLANYKKKGGH